MNRGSKYNIDMVHGPLFRKIILFAMPLILTNVMQLMFHAADLIVLGQFADPKAMAAVGATNGLTTFVLNLFFGLSTGVNVLTAQYIGARDPRNVARTVHTSMSVAFYGGAVMAVIGVLISYADVLVGQAAINPEMRPMIVALVMAVLSPIMAILGEADGKTAPEIQTFEEPEEIPELDEGITDEEERGEE